MGEYTGKTWGLGKDIHRREFVGKEPIESGTEGDRRCLEEKVAVGLGTCPFPGVWETDGIFRGSDPVLGLGYHHSEKQEDVGVGWGWKKF